jgi:peptidoglycan hydrolase CwlO-like protein
MKKRIFMIAIAITVIFNIANAQVSNAPKDGLTIKSNNSFKDLKKSSVR